MRLQGWRQATKKEILNLRHGFVEPGTRTAQKQIVAQVAPWMVYGKREAVGQGNREGEKRKACW